MQQAVELNFFDIKTLVDPFDFFDEALAKHPVVRIPNTNSFVVFSASLVTEMCTRVDDFSSNVGGVFAGQRSDDADIKRISSQGWPFEDTLLTADPPAHTHFRRLVNLAFSKTRVDAMETDIRRIVVRLVEPFIRKRSCELVGEFAMPLPIAVIAGQIGLGHVQQERIKSWSDAVADRFAGVIDRERELECAKQIVEFQHTMLAEVSIRRASPASVDLLDSLVNAKVEGERPLNDGELLSILQQLMVAGNETTRNTISAAMLLLIKNPEAMRWVREDVGRIPKMVEEVLRHESPSQGIWRKVKRDTTLGDVRIPAGANVMGSIGAANRDPKLFKDPSKFDPTRPSRHIAFGTGIHACIGNMLARKELQIAFEEILGRFKNIRLADGFSPIYAPNMVVRGMHSLELLFDPA